MGKPFSLLPREVPPVETGHRRIVTRLPVPESVPLLERLHAVEPRSMSGQPPILWHRADGLHVDDRWGNRWLDFSSGVLVANAGHGHPAIRRALVEQAAHGVLHHYVFPAEPRLELVELLVSLAPAPLAKVFLLTTGSEATECALKLMRSWGQQVGGPRKQVVVSFDHAFHGRTLGAQMMGGIPDLKAWIRHPDPTLVQVPFPDGFRVPDTRFELFEASLAEQGIDPDTVAGVITETYQGVGPDFLPTDYARALRAWCDRCGALLCCDEVQAGFGRCGTLFGFELYGIVPDLVCLGKGMSSSLPISGVLGRADVMDLYPPGSMTSTHSGNPLCCRAAIESIKAIRDGLVDNAARMGRRLKPRLEAIAERGGDRLGPAHSVGLVGGLQFVRRGTTTPDPDAAHEVVRACFERGLLLFAPVGVGGACVKICPPLSIDAAALDEGCDVLAEAVDSVLAPLVAMH